MIKTSIPFVNQTPNICNTSSANTKHAFMSYMKTSEVKAIL